MLILVCSLQKQLWVADGLDDGSGVDQICAGVDSRPGAVLVVEVLDAKLDVGRRPRRLDGGDVAPNDTGTGVFLGHFWEKGVGQSRQTENQRMLRTVNGPEARAGAQIDDFLGVVADRGEKVVAGEEIV